MSRGHRCPRPPRATGHSLRVAGPRAAAGAGAHPRAPRSRARVALAPGPPTSRCQRAPSGRRVRGAAGDPEAGSGRGDAAATPGCALRRPAPAGPWPRSKLRAPVRPRGLPAAPPARFYLFIHERHTHTQRERQRRRQREKQAPCREPDVGLDSGTPGSRPEPKGDAQRLSHPGIPTGSMPSMKPTWSLNSLP
uniref:ESX-1 secretion-associated protein EspI-like isoform X3 n=1 Tax=Nyctereutes procyonoides TaxID=34880 RepID=UPI00244404EE|nr:ESX-1 secretion-associated protein EspI-like isoform X3 [Nyctereutes procyonoides]